MDEKVYEADAEKVHFQHFINTFGSVQNDLLEALNKFVKENEMIEMEEMQNNALMQNFLNRIRKNDNQCSIDLDEKPMEFED